MERHADHMLDPAQLFLRKEHGNAGCVGPVMDFLHPVFLGHTHDP